VSYPTSDCKWKISCHPALFIFPLSAHLWIKSINNQLKLFLSAFGLQAKISVKLQEYVYEIMECVYMNKKIKEVTNTVAGL